MRGRTSGGGAAARIRRSSIAALALGLLGAGGAPPACAQERADRQAERLLGPVRIVAGETWSEVPDGEKNADPRRQPIDTLTFDAAGRMTSRDIIDDYGFAVGRETYRHEGERLVETVLRNDKGAVLERRAYAYFASGRAPTSMTVVESGRPGYEARYSRDAAGRVEHISYLAKGASVGRTSITYAEGQDPTEIAYFTGNGRPAVAPVGPCLGAHRVTLRYADGRVVEQALFEPDGVRKRRTAFAYDIAGNVSSEVRSTPSGETRITHVYQYDARGNWITRRTTIASDHRAAGGRAPASYVRVTRRTLTYD